MSGLGDIIEWRKRCEKLGKKIEKVKIHEETQKKLHDILQRDKQAKRRRLE